MCRHRWSTHLVGHEGAQGKECQSRPCDHCPARLPVTVGRLQHAQRHVLYANRPWNDIKLTRKNMELTDQPCCVANLMTADTLSLSSPTALPLSD